MKLITKEIETPLEFIFIMNILTKMNNVEIELCGSWLWISGNTMQYKADLKKAGCRWSNNKKMWYWRHEENFCKKYKNKTLDMEQIRNRYRTTHLETTTKIDLGYTDSLVLF